MDDTIGKFGLESAMEDYLRGTNGIMTTTTASDGSKTSEITREPVDGDTVILTLDSVLQKRFRIRLRHLSKSTATKTQFRRSVRPW